MFSVGEAASLLGKSHQWVRYVIGTRDLGRKVGWAIVLSSGDIEKLKQVRDKNGEQSKQAA